MRAISTTQKNIQIHQPNLTEGAYFIQLTQGNEHFSEKIIITNK